MVIWLSLGATGACFAVCVLLLFWADLEDWWERRRIRRPGVYRQDWGR